MRASARRVEVGVAPSRTRSIERRMPKRPNRSSSSSRSIDVRPPVVAGGCLRVDEVVDRHQKALESARRDASELFERVELVLAQGHARLRDQPCDGDDRLADPAQSGIARVAGGDARCRVHRVRSTDADLVGSGQDRDDRRRRGLVAVGERVEEAEVGGVQMAGEVDDRVGGAVGRLPGQRELGARRELSGDRRQAQACR